MKGVVAQINRRRGMVAIQTEDGDYSVFELLGNDELVEVGDSVSWPNATGLGSEPLSNLTQGVSFEVYFQNHYVTRANLAQQLLLRPGDPGYGS